MWPMASGPANRTLVLLRHGKSAYPPGVPDHDRPLAPRGRREAALAGQWISRHIPSPDRVVCSTAERTRQTAAAAGLAGPQTSYSADVYEADALDLLDVVRAIDGGARTAVLIGHAPGLPDLALDLAGPGSSPKALDQLDTKFPTSAIAVLEVDGSWADVDPRRVRLVDLVIPRA